MSDSIPLGELPVVVIGAGPIGLAAAAHLHAKSVPFLVLEATDDVAGAVRAWSHVRMFTPWRYNVDAEARQLLEAGNWEIPDPESFPTGGELVSSYLKPLAAHPAIAPYVRVGSRVNTVTRFRVGKLEEDREDQPFAVWIEGSAGDPILSRAVIDASGNWSTPNPAGADGRSIPGEVELGAHIRYGAPDVYGQQRDRYVGRRTLVLGSGHSAFNALDALCRLRTETSSGDVYWALRREQAELVLDSCDETLTERTLQRSEIREWLASDQIVALPGTRLTALESTDGGIRPRTGNAALPEVDEIIVATGFQPDHNLARELRLDLHHTFECAHSLAKLVNPAANACGTVPPHGIRELAHPELDYLIVGSKSYGRAPTFLLLTGYEQVRSIVCAIARDDAAFETGLDLPDRGLCSACTAFLEAQDESLACSCGDESDDGECCDDDELELAGAGVNAGMVTA